MDTESTAATLKSAWQILFALMCAGGLGGIVRAIVENARTENVITLPVSRRTLALGWLGDALIGGCAAIVAYNFFNVLTASQSSATAPEFVRLAGFGIAAGYAGARILNAMLDKFPQQKLDRLAAEQEALRLHSSGKYAMAARKFRELLAADPSDQQTRANLALSLSYTGDEGLKEAIALLDEVIKAEPKRDEAWYNLACLRAVAKHRSYSDEEVFEPLRKALELNADWKSYLAKDVDFDRFRTSPAHAEYQALSGDTATAPLDKTGSQAPRG